MSGIETWQDKRGRLSSGPRLRALETRLARLTEQDVAETRRTLRSIHLLLIDATLDGDTFLLDLAVEGLRGAGTAALGVDADPESRARLQGRAETLGEEALLALERLPSLTGLADYEPDSQAACFLRAIAERPNLSNDEVAEQLETRPERVSALGRELVQRGLAAKRRVGRHNAWDITPRGVQALGLIDAGGARRPQREHRLPALG
jgi:hypothetical protein